MIKNMWYAIIGSKKINNNSIISLTRFGKRIVLFRDSHDELSCFEDVCAHRGASFSFGKVVDDCIKCPFHGIEYDSSGNCKLIPSEGFNSSKDFSRFHLKKYNIEEHEEIVYAWYGDSNPTPLDYFKDLDNSYVYSELSDHWKVHYSRVIENQLDVSHLPFVHYNTIGRGNKTLVNGPKVVWTNENTLVTSANNEVDTGQTPKSESESVIKSTNLTFKFPNMWVNSVNDKIKIMAYFVPVDDENTILTIRFYNKLTPFKFINKFIAFIGRCMNFRIERQDKKVVETQLPKYSDINIHENLLQADKLIIEYRKRRHSLKTKF